MSDPIQDELTEIANAARRLNTGPQRLERVHDALQPQRRSRPRVSYRVVQPVMIAAAVLILVAFTVPVSREAIASTLSSAVGWLTGTAAPGPQVPAGELPAWMHLPRDTYALAREGDVRLIAYHRKQQYCFAITVAGHGLGSDCATKTQWRRRLHQRPIYAQAIQLDDDHDARTMIYGITTSPITTLTTGTVSTPAVNGSFLLAAPSNQTVQVQGRDAHNHVLTSTRIDAPASGLGVTHTTTPDDAAPTASSKSTPPD